jgi:LmbE family N-acetylglucosaminyl deacetylase
MGKEKRKILSISAHWESESRAGGTLAKYSKRGFEVHIANMSYETRNERDKEKRKAEAEEMAKILGVRMVFFDFPCFDLKEDFPTKMCILNIIRELRPEIVFTLHAADPDPDHRAIALATLHAVYLANNPSIETECDPHSVLNVYNFEGRFEASFRKPQNYVDISDTFEEKISALRKESHFLPHEIKDVYQWNAFRGREVGVKFAEAFVRPKIPYQATNKALDILP